VGVGVLGVDVGVGVLGVDVGGIVGVAVAVEPEHSQGYGTHHGGSEGVFGVGVGVLGVDVGVGVLGVGVGVGVNAPSHKVKAPSSLSIALIGLNTKLVPFAVEPHRRPYNVAFGRAPPNTGDPLSPGATITVLELTIVWLSRITVGKVFATATLAFVALTVPCVQPVVLPTLLTTSPNSASSLAMI
jgi:hypothetical protein